MILNASGSLPGQKKRTHSRSKHVVALGKDSGSPRNKGGVMHYLEKRAVEKMLKDRGYSTNHAKKIVSIVSTALQEHWRKEDNARMAVQYKDMAETSRDSA